MSKNRNQTEQNILLAVEQILLNQGFSFIGINAIARQAKCDKVLIYRYFNGLNGLLERFAESRELWWSIDEIVTETKQDISNYTLPEYLELILKRHINSIQQKPLTQEIMAWELSEHNPLTISLARLRAERGMLLLKQVREFYQQPNIDIGGILGIFGAAINYLIIRTRNTTLENAKEEWWRLEQTLSSLLSNQASLSDYN